MATNEQQYQLLLDVFGFAFHFLCTHSQHDFLVTLASRHIGHMLAEAGPLRGSRSYVRDFLNLLEQYHTRPLDEKTRDAIVAMADDSVSYERHRRRMAVTPYV